MSEMYSELYGPVSQAPYFTNQSHAPPLGDMNWAFPNQNAPQPAARTEDLLSCSLDLPAGTTEGEIDELKHFLMKLDTKTSKPRLKEALKIQRSPDKLLKFLEGVHDALDTSVAVAFGNSSQFCDYYYVSTCTVSGCTRVNIIPKKSGVCRNCQDKARRLKPAKQEPK
jgi:hypothetical protein